MVPDIIIFGKALTNGLNPLSGIWAKEELINPDVFPPGSTHSTFASNPIGTAAGLATLKEFDVWKTKETDISAKGTYFLEKLKGLKKQYSDIVGDVDGLGMALRIEICDSDGFSPSRKRADFLFNEGLKADLQNGTERVGLILDIGGYYKNVITLAPNLLMTETEIDIAIDLLSQLFL